MKKLVQAEGRTLQCKQCSAPFVVDRKGRLGRAKFCSPRCWYDFRLRARWRKCKQCGTKFEAKPPLTKASKFCSRRCLLLSRGSVKVCRGCGKEYQACPSVRLRYCGWECYRATKAVSNAPKKCENCGNDFVKRDAATTRLNRFCSRKCVTQFWKKYRHPAWRGGRKAERGSDWPEARDAARVRDGKLCHRCGMEDALRKQLSVDHIVPYRLVMQLRKDDPSIPSANELTNLVCLCQRCHMHKTAMEKDLFAGDVIGFIGWTQCLIDLDRILDALELYGLLPRGYGPKSSAVLSQAAEVVCAGGENV